MKLIVDNLPETPMNCIFAAWIVSSVAYIEACVET